MKQHFFWIATWKEFVFSWLHRQYHDVNATHNDQKRNSVVAPEMNSIRHHLLDQRTFQWTKDLYSGKSKTQLYRLEYQFDQLWKAHAIPIQRGNTLYTTLRSSSSSSSSSSSPSSMAKTDDDTTICWPKTWDEVPTALHHFARRLVSYLSSSSLPQYVINELTAPLCGYWIRNNESTLCKVCKEGYMDIVESGTSMVCNQCHYMMDLPSITQSTVSFGGTNKDPRGSQRVEQTRPELLRMHYVEDFFVYLQNLRLSSLGKEITEARLANLADDIVRRVTVDDPQASLSYLDRVVWEKYPWIPLHTFLARVSHDEFWKPHNIHRNHKSAIMSRLVRGAPIHLSKSKELFITFCLHRIERALPNIVRAYPWLRAYKRRHLPKAVHLFAGICTNMGWDECISFPPKPALTYRDLVQFEYVRMYFWHFLGWTFIPLCQPLPRIYLRCQSTPSTHPYAPEHYQPHTLRELWLYAATQRIQTLRRWLLQGRPPTKDTDWWQIPPLQYVSDEISDRCNTATRSLLYHLFTDARYEANSQQCMAALSPFMKQSLSSYARDDPESVQLPCFLFAHPREKDLPPMERSRESRLRDESLRQCLSIIRDTLGMSSTASLSSSATAAVPTKQSRKRTRVRTSNTSTDQQPSATKSRRQHPVSSANKKKQASLRDLIDG
jgi:hypothetical protein